MGGEEGYAYQGGELELFHDAINWKHYWSSAIARFVQGAVLEVGAGIGGSTPFLRRDQHSRWLCLEPDAELARRLSERMAQGAVPAGCEIRNGRLADLDKAERFDTILYIDVLEHIADDAGELRLAAAHLAPGGRVVALSPALPFLYSSFDAAIGHHRRYTAAALAAITPSGTVLERLFYLDSVGLLASLGNRLLLRTAMPSRGQVLLWDRLMVPMSRIADPLLFHKLGKSVVSIWRRS
jgi:2-polyprenyl-3-methyl-5-hydroxy-6-metoxy-1,4-benzoquinol methylase